MHPTGDHPGACGVDAQEHAAQVPVTSAGQRRDHPARGHEHTARSPRTTAHDLPDTGNLAR
jgi:hypothetical protein